jgi:hypothetical protein
MIRLGGGSLLSLLLFVDVTLITVQIWLLFRGIPHPYLHIEVDGSIPEWFNHLKGIASALACGYAFSRRAEPLYLIWAVLFAYFLLDDAGQLHEQLGHRLVAVFGLEHALALRAEDFGELAVNFASATALLGAMSLLLCSEHRSSQIHALHATPASLAHCFDHLRLFSATCFTARAPCSGRQGDKRARAVLIGADSPVCAEQA